MIRYFAYGSNMSERRMIDRNIKTYSKSKGVLKGYKLVINKKSYKNPNIGFANVILDKNSEVEGILYDIDENCLNILDKYEGFPKHYNRYKIKIDVEGGEKEGIIYIANDNWTTSNELNTTKEYKNYILEGKEFLSKNYYNKLLEIKTI